MKQTRRGSRPLQRGLRCCFAPRTKRFRRPAKLLREKHASTASSTTPSITSSSWGDLKAAFSFRRPLPRPFPLALSSLSPYLIVSRRRSVGQLLQPSPQPFELLVCAQFLQAVNANLNRLGVLVSDTVDVFRVTHLIASVQYGAACEFH